MSTNTKKSHTQIVWGKTKSMFFQAKIEKVVLKVSENAKYESHLYSSKRTRAMSYFRQIRSVRIPFWAMLSFIADSSLNRQRVASEVLSADTLTEETKMQNLK